MADYQPSARRPIANIFRRTANSVAHRPLGTWRRGTEAPQTEDSLLGGPDEALHGGPYEVPYGLLMSLFMGLLMRLLMDSLRE